jgi:hypothetical protein
LRKGHDTIVREVLDWNPQGQRKRGRPKQMWMRSVHNEALGEGRSWGEVKQLARNRIRWRSFANRSSSSSELDIMNLRKITETETNGNYFVPLTGWFFCTLDRS